MSDNNEILSATEAARSFSELLHRVHYQHKSFVITKGARKMAQLVPVEDSLPASASLAELVKRLAEFPSLDDAEAEEHLALIKQMRVMPPQFRPWD